MPKRRHRYAPTIPSGKEDWRSVRQQRSNPDGLAGEFDDRRHVFQAALAQAEELWDAAAVAGPASRPLPLFYCLSQAGRAVCAAWSRTREWRPMAHGLGRRVSDDETPERRVLNYSARVTGHTLGAYSMVADATASTKFIGYASVAQIWASIPGFPTPRGLFGDAPRCLTLEPAQHPEDERPTFARVLSPTHGVFRHSGDIRIEDLPSIYPTTEGVEQHGTHVDVLGDERPLYRFLRDDGRLRPLSDVGVMPFWAKSTFREGLVVRPKIGTGSARPPSEFLTMWALLFCLSELARYYPDTWVGALDPDHSNAAVTLEHGIDIALERAPALIADALGGPISEMVREELERRDAAGNGGEAAAEE